MDNNQKMLIEKAKQGDNLAISEIMNQYNSELFNLARMYSKTEEDAKDAVQNAYIRAFRNLSTLEDNSKFDAWIKQITVNEAKRIVMSSYNQKNTMFSDLDNEEENINYDPEDEKIENQPEMAYDKKETSEIVLSILDRLSEDQRIVALMHFYENKTLKEIAEELKIPQSTVIGRIQTAKKNIKASVLELENKEGIKLYNMAPLPFFVYLLHLSQGMPIPASLIRAIPEVEVEPTPLKSEPTEVLKLQGEPEVLRPSQQPAQYNAGVDSVKGNSKPLVAEVATQTVSGTSASILKVVLGVSMAAVVGFGGKYLYDSTVNKTDNIDNNPEIMETVSESEESNEVVVEKEPQWVILKSMSYDANNNVIHSVKYDYDENGNNTNYTENQNGVETTCNKGLEFDSDGNLIKTIFYDDDGSEIGWQEYTYDSQGNNIKTTSYDADGKDTSYDIIREYDNNNHLIKETSYTKGLEFNRIEYEYDENGRLFSSKSDFMGRTENRIYEYDENNKVVKITIKGDSVPESYVLMDRDSHGNCIKESRYDENDVLVNWVEHEYIELDDYLAQKK